MRIRFFAISAIALVVSVSTESRACPEGDPACVGGRHPISISTIRHDELNHSANPVHIVMFANPSSTDAKMTMSAKLASVLSKIGHSVTVVESRQELEAILINGKTQIVLGLYSDVADLRGSYLVVPVIVAGEQVDRLRYPDVLTSSPRPSAHIPPIERAALRASH